MENDKSIYKMAFLKGYYHFTSSFVIFLFEF